MKNKKQYVWIKSGDREVVFRPHEMVDRGGVPSVKICPTRKDTSEHGTVIKMGEVVLCPHFKGGVDPDHYDEAIKTSEGKILWGKRYSTGEVDQVAQASGFEPSMFYGHDIPGWSDVSGWVYFGYKNPDVGSGENELIF